ncbi:PspC domain-containing protein [Clostridium sp. MSJ-8]|uniref:PspC domain-containing protein n=1 Tax=Clostridium sp. MSJ-8 TaxID=2841510 RepID=UPI00209C85DA|nr:PspC domain-containing protein [Clostridium sp. MSJ-8]
MMEKKLYKNKSQGKICGVCAGLAEYLNCDVTIVRIVALILILAYGSGLIIYFVSALIMPDKSQLY